MADKHAALRGIERAAAIGQLVRDMDRLIEGAAPHLPAFRLNTLRAARNEAQAAYEELTNRPPMVVQFARNQGAIIVQTPEGMWKVLDQPDTPLWWALFANEENAARAYCAQHDLEVPGE
jgi:hypothetical protein